MRVAAAFFFATLAFAPLAHAESRVGVTSQTNGDPLGKPPTQAERVLRVGIDIQAEELITTHEDDRAHLVFLDGTSLTVGPNAQLKVDRFVYDSASRTGDLAVSVGKGVFRLVGGRISKTTPIVINTPSSTIGIRGGIGVFSVDPRQTTSQFLFGISMTVTAHGHTETAIRPGSQITTLAGGVPGTPILIPSGALTRTFSLLEAHSAKGSNTGTGTGSADQHAQHSGFSDQNSGKGPTVRLNSLMNTEGLAQAINGGVLSQSRQQLLTSSATLPSPSTAPPTPVTGTIGGISGGSPPPPPPPSGPGCYGDDFSHHHHFNDIRFRR